MDLNRVCVLTPAETAEVAEYTCAKKASKVLKPYLFSSILAGLFISIAFAFYIVATVGASGMPYGVGKLIGGITFSLGLILVVVCGVDLFTSTVLAIVPKTTGKLSWRGLIRSWSIVYTGNFIGALLFVAMIWFAGVHMSANAQWGVNVLNIASYKVHHTFIEAIMLGILANMMVCLAVWMSFSGQSLTDKTVIIIMPIAMFVASGFEHSIANMFMIPLGIIIKEFATPEFWQIANLTAEKYQVLTIYNFIIYNLIPVTIGNIIGGLLVGLSFTKLNLEKAKKLNP